MTRHVTAEPLSWELVSGRDDPAQRYRIYRLVSKRIGGRNFGGILELVATCATEAAVGTTLCTLGREEEWDGVAVGVLDTEGEKDRKWIVNPWTRGG